ncbi:MAG: AEC family transporter [Chloroflexi bacterium]|nr:AEC family transporter [Chloroflexota bacterium]
MLPAVLRVLTEIVLPIFAIAGLGFVISRIKKIPPGAIATLTLYLFSPCLAFSGLTKATVSGGDALQIVLFAALMTAAMWAISTGIARVSRMDRGTESGFLLTSLFGNAGNFGLPLVLLAFGQAGFERAVIYFICSAVLSNSLGVFVASRSNSSIMASVRTTFQMPVVYSSFAALAVLAFGLTVPPIIARPAELLGNAAIPCMLVVLGAQLASNPKIEGIGRIVAVSSVRLLLSAVVAWVITLGLGIDGVTRNVLILQSSMPAAVITIILATEFGANAQFVTGVVLVSTLASMLTITGLLTVMLGS